MGNFFNQYTINDICEEILLAEGGSFKSESPKLKIIRESQGIVDDYYSIVGEIYDEISKIRSYPYDDDYAYLAYRLDNYVMKQDCFIKTVNIRVLAGKKGPKFRGSHFDRNYNNIELSKDLKLLNATFVISIDDNDLNTPKSKGEFFRKMAHEIHHAFRFYNIIISNNASIENEKEAVSRYGNIMNVLINGSDDQWERFLSPNLYMINKNEIISEANELYEYIRQHEEINIHNLTNVIKDLPLFWRISRAAKFIKYLDNIMFNEKDKDKINELGKAYIKLMNFENVRPDTAFLKCRNNAAGYEEYVRNVFFRTVNKAFDDFDRKKENMSFNSDEMKEIIEKNEHFDLLKEIFNKH